MSGPVLPSAGRAGNANHSLFGEDAADWPTRTTSCAIWMGPPGVADGVTATDGGGDAADEPLGVEVGGADGVEVARALAVALAVGLALGGVAAGAGTVGVGEVAVVSDGVADGV